MKKTISLVLALVMVFAIASSASAITGLINPELTVANNGPYTGIDLQLIESVGSGFGILSLQPIAANKAYIYDGVVHFALTYTVPQTISMHADDYKNPYVLFSSDVVNFWKDSVKTYRIDPTTAAVIEAPAAGNYASTNKYYEYEVNTSAAKTSSRLYVQLADPTTGSYKYVIVGSGVVAAKTNGTLQADLLGDINCAKFLSMPATINGVIASVATGLKEMASHNIYSGDKVVYNVQMSGTAAKGDKIYYRVTPADSANSVLFVTDYTKTTASGSHNNVDYIYVTYGQKNYLVQDIGTILGGNAATQLKFYEGDGTTAVEVTNADTYAALKKLYEGVMTYFGLEFAKEGVLLPQHFAYKFSTFHATDAEKINLYTNTIVIPDESTDIPQTGDAATSIGFVMIALAIVAACGVAYKKVRA